MSEAFVAELRRHGGSLGEFAVGSAVQLPVPGRAGHPILLLDVGANTEARAVDLVQFAYLGSAFSTDFIGYICP